jgi:tripartite-type tricarboxylate transporter receptor subunit TctC
MVRRVGTIVVIAGCILMAGMYVYAQDSYPNKTIQIVVPFSPGGTHDLTARIVAEKMSGILGASFIVVNKTGGGASIGTAFVGTSKPDGYTLLDGAGSFLTLPMTAASVPYKVSDFTPVGRMVTGNFMIVVNKSIPAKNLAELVAYVKKNPGKISYSAGTSGSIPRLGSEVFKDKAQIDAQYIPYPGMSQGMVALMGNHVQFGVFEVLYALPQVKSGELRPLAVLAAKRDPDLPDVPTSAEVGYPDAIAYTYGILYAPAKTPAPVLTKLGNALEKALQDKAVQEGVTKSGAHASYLNSSETRAFMDAEIKRWSEVVKRVKITADN